MRFIRGAQLSRMVALVNSRAMSSATARCLCVPSAQTLNQRLPTTATPIQSRFMCAKAVPPTKLTKATVAERVLKVCKSFEKISPEKVS